MRLCLGAHSGELGNSQPNVPERATGATNTESVHASFDADLSRNSDIAANQRAVQLCYQLEKNEESSGTVRNDEIEKSLTTSGSFHRRAEYTASRARVEGFYSRKREKKKDQDHDFVHVAHGPG